MRVKQATRRQKQVYFTRNLRHPGSLSLVPWVTQNPDKLVGQTDQIVTFGPACRLDVGPYNHYCFIRSEQTVSLSGKVIGTHLMQRGYPRPKMFVEKCQTNIVVTDSGTTLYGQGYGDRWDNKTYPVPYTAEDRSISSLHGGRMVECATFKKCVACGDPVTEPDVSLLRKKGKLISESGPFHEKCARLTARMCPHIAESKEYAFSVEPWANVKSEILRLLG